MAKGGQRKSDGARHAAEDLHEASPGEGCLRLRACTFNQQLVYLFNPPGPALPFLRLSPPIHISSKDGRETREAGMRSPLRGGWISGEAPTLPGLG